MRLFFIIASLVSISSVESQHMHPKVISEQEIDYPIKDTSVIEDVFNVCIYPFYQEPTVDMEKWKGYLKDNLVLDKASMDTIPAGRYTFFVQFAVGENGKLSSISILKERGYGLGERVKKVVSNCIGIWKPVIKENGQIVPNYRRQPITFVVEEICEELPEALTL